jgi:hypothetical protein
MHEDILAVRFPPCVASLAEGAPLGSPPAERACFRQFRLGGIKITSLSRKCGATRFKTPGANLTKNSPNLNSRTDSGGATLPRHGDIAASISKCSIEDDANQRYLTTLSTNAVPRPRISRRAAKSWLRQRGDYFGDIVSRVPATMISRRSRVQVKRHLPVIRKNTASSMPTCLPEKWPRPPSWLTRSGSHRELCGSVRRHG